MSRSADKQSPLWVQALLDKSLSAVEYRVWSYICWRQGDNETAWVKQDTIAWELHLKTDSVRKIANRLAAKGWVEIIRPPHTAPGKSLQYRATRPANTQTAVGVIDANTQMAVGVNTQTAKPRHKGRTLTENTYREEPPVFPAKAKESRQSRQPFIPPTVDEVREYARSRGYPDFNAEKFVEYYAAANWHDSKGNPVRNWKQKFLAVWAKEAAPVKPQGEVNYGYGPDGPSFDAMGTRPAEDDELAALAKAAGYSLEGLG